MSFLSVMTSLVWAQDAGAPGGSGAQAGGSAGLLVSFLPFLLIFVAFYFLLIRPQQTRQKKHREMLEALKKGDRVLTTGGLMGSVVAIQDKVVTVQFSDTVRIKVRKDFVGELRQDKD